MRFIERTPLNSTAMIIRLDEDKEDATEDDDYALNFALYTEKHQELAAGRCSVKSEGGIRYLFISAIYVENHTNKPTKENPNKYVGLGQILVFAAIRFGFQLNIKYAKLIAVEDSAGFYLKMGFHPELSGKPNRMSKPYKSIKSNDGRLNKDWLNAFENASYGHTSFRGPIWVGCISMLYAQLRDSISKKWVIIE